MKESGQMPEGETPRVILVKGPNVITDRFGNPIGAIIVGDASLDYDPGVEVVMEQTMAEMWAANRVVIRSPEGDRSGPTCQSDTDNNGSNLNEPTDYDY